jgi:ADP-heptose:LPS heptosyltransferase
MGETDQESFLIVLTGSLGDVARGLAVVAPLRAAFPGARIGWLVDTRWAPLVELHPEISMVHRFERRGGLGAQLSLIRGIRSARYKTALDLQRILKSGLLSWLSGAPRRIGFHRRDTKEGNWIWNNQTIAPFGEQRPKLAQYLEFIKVLGGKAPRSVDFGLQGVNAVELLGSLAANLPPSSIGILLGSAWESKDWPLQGYAALVQQLVRTRRESIVLLGDKGRVEMANQIAQAVGSDRVLNLAGRTDLRQLIGALKTVRMLVSPDSGPAHVAAVFGTPTVTLFGPTSPLRTAPYSQTFDAQLLQSAFPADEAAYQKLLETVTVQGRVGCAPCYRRICPGLGTICMRSISVQSVVEPIERVLSS